MTDRQFFFDGDDFMVHGDHYSNYFSHLTKEQKDTYLEMLYGAPNLLDAELLDFLRSRNLPDVEEIWEGYISHAPERDTGFAQFIERGINDFIRGQEDLVDLFNPTPSATREHQTNRAIRASKRSALAEKMARNLLEREAESMLNLEEWQGGMVDRRITSRPT